MRSVYRNFVRSKSSFILILFILNLLQIKALEWLSNAKKNFDKTFFESVKFCFGWLVGWFVLFYCISNTFWVI